MKHTQYFKNETEFNNYFPDGVVPSNVLAVIGEYEKVYTQTNNINGTSYEYQTGEGGSSTVEGNSYITSNGQYNVASYAYAYVDVPVPSGYIVPSGTIDVSSNGTVDVSSYASAYVQVSAPEPSLTWNTVSATEQSFKCLELTIGSTYVFKADANVKMMYAFYDSDGDGDVDLDDAYEVVVGFLTANNEFYYTASFDPNTVGYNSTNIYFTDILGNPTNATIQYAILPTA